MVGEHSLEKLIDNYTFHSKGFFDRWSIRGTITTAIIAVGLVVGVSGAIKYIKQEGAKLTQSNNAPLEVYNNFSSNQSNIESKTEYDNLVFRKIRLFPSQTIWDVGKSYLKNVLGDHYNKLNNKDILIYFYTEETLKMNGLNWKDAREITPSQIIRLPELVYNPKSDILSIITEDNKGKIKVYQTKP